MRCILIQCSASAATLHWTIEKVISLLSWYKFVSNILIFYFNIWDSAPKFWVVHMFCLSLRYVSVLFVCLFWANIENATVQPIDLSARLLAKSNIFGSIYGNWTPPFPNLYKAIPQCPQLLRNNKKKAVLCTRHIFDVCSQPYTEHYTLIVGLNLLSVQYKRPNRYSLVSTDAYIFAQKLCDTSWSDQSEQILYLKWVHQSSIISYTDSCWRRRRHRTRAE